MSHNINMDKNNCLFSKRIKELRIENSLTQKQLAEILFIDRTAVSGWETKNKQPDYETLIKLAKLFNVSTDYLLGLEEF